MTNEEKILNTFPNVTVRIIENKDFRYIEVEQNDKWIADFSIEWWNSEYEEPCEIEADNIPSAEPKAGHWIIDKTEERGIHIINYRCSCCNRYNILHGDRCKWCGAKMESEYKE